MILYGIAMRQWSERTRRRRQNFPTNWNGSLSGDAHLRSNAALADRSLERWSRMRQDLSKQCRFGQRVTITALRDFR
jgi:hypothetical protein